MSVWAGKEQVVSGGVDKHRASGQIWHGVGDEKGV